VIRCEAFSMPYAKMVSEFGIGKRIAVWVFGTTHILIITLIIIFRAERRARWAKHSKHLP
jgi:hypothetical protein